jgi:hypothetical protein
MFMCASPHYLLSDGNIDILAASPGDNTLRYFESNGAATPTFTTRIITSTASGASSLFAADYDRDGDMDILLCVTAGG